MAATTIDAVRKSEGNDNARTGTRLIIGHPRKNGLKTRDARNEGTVRAIWECLGRWPPYGRHERTLCFTHRRFDAPTTPVCAAGFAAHARLVAGFRAAA